MILRSFSVNDSDPFNLLGDMLKKAFCKWNMTALFSFKMRCSYIGITSLLCDQEASSVEIQIEHFIRNANQIFLFTQAFIVGSKRATEMRLFKNVLN